MNITLISPRIAIQKDDFLGSGVLYWPVELATLAAYLRHKGEAISILDLLGESPRTLEDVGDHYLQGASFKCFAAFPEVLRADVFIIYALSYMSHREVLSIAAEIRRVRPEAVVVVLENSQAVTAYSLAMVAGDFFDQGVDALICGEIYWNWEEVRAFLEHPTSSRVPENILVKTTPLNFILRRKINKSAHYPLPAWEMFNLRNYWALPYSHGPKTGKYLPIITSRGCPCSCDFCVSPGTNDSVWRGRDPEEVVGEIIALRDSFGVRHFQIEDLNPTVDRARWETICRLLIERNAGIFFYFVSGTKAETIHVDQIPLYAEAGCRYISISPESGSTEVLRSVGKHFDHAHALELVGVCRRHGISTQACLLVGHPAENAEAHGLSCDYVRQLVRAGLDEIGVFVVAPLPGSLLYRENRVKLSSCEALVSFSPKGRIDWKHLNQLRLELIHLFFWEKLKRGPDLWLQGWRSVFGVPRTKMENLPQRMVLLYRMRLGNFCRKN